MLKLVCNINLGPYNWVEQQLSHGRVHLVKCYRRQSYGAVPVLNDPAKQVIVRFICGGKMYAGFVPKKHAAAAYRSHTTYRPAAPKALGGMLSNLTAIEAANRARVLQAARASR